MESLEKSTNQEESFKSRNGEVPNRSSKNHWVMVETAEDALADGQTTEMVINQTSQNQTIENKQRMGDEFKTLLQETNHSSTILEMAREASSNDFLSYILEDIDLLSCEGQDMESMIPWTTYWPFFGFGDSQIQCGEAAYACQNSQNKPKQAAVQPIHYDGTLSFRPSRKENSTTRWGNILPNGTESDVCNLKGKSTLDSVILMTPKERKKLNDQKHRKKKREELINLKEDKKNLIETVKRLEDQLKYVSLTSRHYQPQSSLVKRKAMFQLNFNDNETKKKALNMVHDLPDMDYVLLKEKEGILKMKGSFDIQTVLHKLNTVCPTHLVSKMYAIADPSMPGPSTAAN